MEKKLNTVGLDQIKLYNIKCLNLPDLSKLTQMDNVAVTQKNLNGRAGNVIEINDAVLPGCGSERFGLLKITIPKNQNEIDGIDDLNEEAAPINDVLESIKVSITLTVKSAYGTNLNSHSHAEYVQRLPLIQKYIMNQYGIKIGFDDVNVGYMEINEDIELDQDFAQYRRILDFLIQNTKLLYGDIYRWANFNENPKKNGKNEIENGKENINTCGIRNSSWDIKLYNKREQMIRTGCGDPGKNLLRIEITLKTSKKISELFGKNFFDGMNDKIITDKFYQIIQKYFVKKFIKYEEDTSNYIKNTLLYYRDDVKTKKWIKKGIEHIRNDEQANTGIIVLDLCQITSIITDIGRTAWFKYGCIKNIYKDQGLIIDNVYMQNDLEATKDLISRFLK